MQARWVGGSAFGRVPPCGADYCAVRCLWRHMPHMRAAHGTAAAAAAPLPHRKAQLQRRGEPQVAVVSAFIVCVRGAPPPAAVRAQVILRSA